MILPTEKEIICKFAISFFRKKNILTIYMEINKLFNKQKHHIGVALSGGGAKGLCHAGSIKALEEFNIRPDIISGVSAGAIVAAFYADGYTPDEIHELFSDVKFRSWTSLTLPTVGIFNIEPFMRFLKKNLHAKRIEDLQIPIRIVATNLDEGKSEVFTEGNLVERIAASCSVPILFEPRVINNKNYVDGGVFMNFPVRVIRNDCQNLIGINASPMTTNDYRRNIAGIAQRTYHFMFKANIIPDKNLCDLLIEPPSMENYETFDAEKTEEIFNVGYTYTKNLIEHRLNEIARLNPLEVKG